LSAPLRPSTPVWETGDRLRKGPDFDGGPLVWAEHPRAKGREEIDKGRTQKEAKLEKHHQLISKKKEKERSMKEAQSMQGGKKNSAIKEKQALEREHRKKKSCLTWWKGSLLRKDRIRKER